MPFSINQVCPYFLEARDPANKKVTFLNSMNVTSLSEYGDGIYANVGKERYQLVDSDTNDCIVSRMLNIRA